MSAFQPRGVGLNRSGITTGYPRLYTRSERMQADPLPAWMLFGFMRWPAHMRDGLRSASPGHPRSGPQSTHFRASSQVKAGIPKVHIHPGRRSRTTKSGPENWTARRLAVTGITVYKRCYGIPEGQVRAGREGTNPQVGQFPARAASTHAERAAIRQKRCAPATLRPINNSHRPARDDEDSGRSRITRRPSPSARISE